MKKTVEEEMVCYKIKIIMKKETGSIKIDKEIEKEMDTSTFLAIPETEKNKKAGIVGCFQVFEIDKKKKTMMLKKIKNDPEFIFDFDFHNFSHKLISS